MPKAKGQPNLTKASFEAAARQHKWEFKNAAQAPQGDRTWIYKCGGDVTIMHWATTGTVNLVLKGKCTHWAWNPEENWNKDCYTKTDEHLTSDDVGWEFTFDQSLRSGLFLTIFISPEWITFYDAKR